ncbi:DUF2574 domain-containing protein [Chimaeribacter arupi]|uniref:DUF2574 domain-containing protein n=2 Tax=Yersiniaceae TaxID=1903411 RepID=A0A2N5EPE3_9GAMM|nr:MULTISPECIES: fimbrial protein [Yersiniaceae]MBS0968035.1 type 1 fimbrial protein [Nissabacter archeti]PLR33897.1 DUF2574 domain-containing protein [Chimaeribacter arupi]PLR50386.1 DUF2574 domain-containing protein [Chimaeribacter arupi]PLR51161.1 DUF2574 domain-containing protein [Chimaeribacter arupi]PLR54481.1 DUF2574 domain-containing protein [Chimaeribacter arupi]
MKSTLKKTALLTGLTFAALGMASSGYSADTGKVNFSGKIIAPPCEVDASNTVTNVAAFSSVGANTFNDQIGVEGSESRDFDIILKNCPTDTTINVGFSGPTDGANTTLAVDESSAGKGVGIVVYHKGSTDKVKFDSSIDAAHNKTLAESGESTFSYTAKLISTKSVSDMTNGDFTASADFTVYYP